MDHRNGAHNHEEGLTALREGVEMDADPVDAVDADPASSEADSELEEVLEDEESNLGLHKAVQASKSSYQKFTVADEAQAIKNKLATHREERERTVKKQWLSHQADVRKTLKWISDEVSSARRGLGM